MRTTVASAATKRTAARRTAAKRTRTAAKRTAAKRKRTAAKRHSFSDPTAYYNERGRTALGEVVCFDGICKHLVLKPMRGKLLPQWDNVTYE